MGRMSAFNYHRNPGHHDWPPNLPSGERRRTLGRGQKRLRRCLLDGGADRSRDLHFPLRKHQIRIGILNSSYNKRSRVLGKGGCI